MRSATAAVLWFLCITTQPKDGLAEFVIRENEGDNVLLLCHSAEGDTVSWSYRGTDPTSAGDQYICIDGNVLPDYSHRFTLSTDEHNHLHILTISKVQSSDSGIYTCIENEGLGSKHFVRLMVLSTVDGESTTQSPVPDSNDDSLPESESSTTLWKICIAILIVLCLFVFEFQLAVFAVVMLFRRLWINRKRDHEASDHNSSTETKLLLHDENSLTENDHHGKDVIWVSGLALFESKLYLLRAGTIEMYETATDKLHPLKTHPMKGLQTHYRNDMTLCVNNRCLYISDYINKCIQRLMLPLADDTKPNEINIFNMPDNIHPSGLSVTRRSTLLVTCFNARKLVEVSVTEGDTYGKLGLRKVREVALQSDIEWPMHAIEMPDDKYVVCHGGDGLWIVDISGCIIHSYSDGLVPGLKNDGNLRPVAWPCHLAVDEDRTIIVADNYNDRLVLLNSDLEFQRELKSTDSQSEIFRPRRLCLDTDKHTLYIGQYNGQLILHKN